MTKRNVYLRMREKYRLERLESEILGAKTIQILEISIEGVEQN